MAKYFGTDGIRGRTDNQPCDIPFTKDFIKKTANALAMFLLGNANQEPSLLSPALILGNDTRESCHWIKAIFTQTLPAHGIKVTDVDVVPTAVVPFLVFQQTISSPSQLTYGIMITASHNPAEWNGLKFFNPNGEKLSEQEVTKIEDLITIAAPVLPTINKQIYVYSTQNTHTSISHSSAQGAEFCASESSIHCVKFTGFGRQGSRKEGFPLFVEGAGEAMPPQKELWVEYLISKFCHLKHSKYKPLITIDCANGSGAEVAHNVLTELGWQFMLVNDTPDGVNINKSTISIVKGICFAFDGDADRATIYMDNKKLHGDILITLLATWLHSKKQLNNNTVVSTVLFNGGAEKYLTCHGISLIRTPVGDKHITRIIKENNLSFGGEESGHIILLDPDLEFSQNQLKCGDGLQTSLTFLSMLCDIGMHELKERVKQIELYKSISRNVKSTQVKKELIETKQFIQAIDALQSKNEDHRIIIRASGTEDLIRIYVEGPNKKTCELIVSQVLNLLN